MSVASLIASHNSGDDWVLDLVPLKNHGLIGSFSDGSLKLYPLNLNQDRNFKPIKTIKAHQNSINSIRSDGGNLIGTASEDSIKIFDLRNNNNKPIAIFQNQKNIPFLSLDFKNNLIAGGTELKQADAELHIWDIRNQKQIVRSFIDSHHDDITEIKFHPIDDSLLLSGSTDGYINIYDLNIPDEDDALHQVINFASIHSAGWLSSKRIYALSHMETFSIYELNDKSDELNEPQPLEFGDVREPWDCEYIIDVYPGFIAAGTNSKSHAKLYPFINEKIDLNNPIKLNGAHGEEVVRTIYCPPKSNLIYTGGEDGNLRVWKADVELNAPQSFFKVEGQSTTIENEDVEMEDPNIERSDSNSNCSSSEESKEKSKKKDKKDKKDKKHKHKDSKVKKSKKEHRFRPY